jgi:hypothetical protein
MWIDQLLQHKVLLNASPTKLNALAVMECESTLFHILVRQSTNKNYCKIIEKQQDHTQFYNFASDEEQVT